VSDREPSPTLSQKLRNKNGLLRKGGAPGQITSPTLLFWGLESFAPVPENDPRVTAMQHCRLIKVPKAGHWVHHDQLDLFLRETKGFLAE
jgi:pimeloyl-ACP methyl ester carboxylesterase